MQGTIISDTSVLILLEKINELNILQKCFGEVVTTDAISIEFGNALPKWIRIENAVNKESQRVLEISLGKGEASAIALALENIDCLLIIDENKGRNMARQLGINITGTLGVIVDAKRKGHYASVKTILEKIEKTDFRMSQELKDQILKLAGESK